MLTIIETVIAFAVIMLTLSYLVKCLTTLVKNYFDYYSTHFKREVERLVRDLGKDALEELQSKKSWAGQINWRGLSEEYFTKDNITLLMNRLGLDKSVADDMLAGLEERLQVHKANLAYAFEKRTKNISIALGLVLCLGLNINALTIWSSLYQNANLRAKFTSDQYVQQVLQKGEQSQGDENRKDDAEKQRQQLQEERDQFLGELDKMRSELSFGVGKIWKSPPKGWKDFCYDFLGALLTGLLLSIGAPYWHDLLKAMASLRKKGAPA